MLGNTARIKIFAEKLLKMLDKAMINLYNYFVAGTGLTF